MYVPARPYIVGGHRGPDIAQRPGPGSGLREDASTGRPGSGRDEQPRRSGPSGRHLPPPPPPGPIARVASAAVATIPVRGERTPLPVGPPRPVLPIPHLRRNVCPHFYMTGARGAIPVQAPHLLKALMRQDSNISRCQLRGGVHLDAGYVTDICLSSRFNQCVFYEDDLTHH
ncbi:MAG TPA: hypothetical protein VFW92_05710 [Candidatus Limnocylindrales bacterium]|nr:hypothetical protein [Candidatus Limnocylindrales bacterium]